MLFSSLPNGSLAKLWIPLSPFFWLQYVLRLFKGRRVCLRAPNMFCLFIGICLSIVGAILKYYWRVLNTEQAECQAFSPVVGIGTPPTSHPQARACPPWFRGEGHTRWRERGWESPNSDEGTYTVVLFIYMYFLVLNHKCDCEETSNKYYFFNITAEERTM